MIIKPNSLPIRVLGRTNENVTILGLGTSPIGEGSISKQQARKVFEYTIDNGVNLIDTAPIYGNAEEVLGEIIPTRRNSLYLATKVCTEYADQAEFQLTKSLETLNTDYIDLCYIHNIGDKNIDIIESKTGVLNYLIYQQRIGRVRHIGVSAHSKGDKILRILNTGIIDVAMFVINYADRYLYNFENRILPFCFHRNIGVVAMKVYTGIVAGIRCHTKGHIGCATPPELLPHAMAYVLDLPGVSTALIGPFTIKQAQSNVDIARSYLPLTNEHRNALLAYGEKLSCSIGFRYGPE